MKFTKIRLKGLTAVDFPVTDALPSDPYILKNIDGLGPPEVDVLIGATLNTGGVYQGRRPQSREVVIFMGLNPDYPSGQNASDLRSALYGALTPGYGDQIELDVMDGDTVLAVAQGFVKKMEIVPFNKDPEVQITIPCLQPYLEAPNDLYVAPGGTKAAPQISNVGTAETGFRMEVIFTADSENWTLFDSKGNKMEFEYSFLAGDTLIFDTRPGNRGVWLTRDLLTSSVIYALTPDSIWFVLYGGTNDYTTSSQGYNWGDVYYKPKFWGI